MANRQEHWHNRARYEAHQLHQAELPIVIVRLDFWQNMDGADIQEGARTEKHTVACRLHRQREYIRLQEHKGQQGHYGSWQSECHQMTSNSWALQAFVHEEWNKSESSRGLNN